jgi:hypothetical protein
MYWLPRNLDMYATIYWLPRIHCSHLCKYLLLVKLSARWSICDWWLCIIILLL